MVLFLIAARSAFFSPAKYGILPEVFDDGAISSANGILELITDLAILIGSLVGVYVYSLFSSNLTAAGLLFLAIACLGTHRDCVRSARAGGQSRRTSRGTSSASFGRDLPKCATIATLYYTLVGIAWFGFLASFFLTVFRCLERTSSRWAKREPACCFALLSIGIGLGAVVAGRVSRKHVEIGLVPLGSIGITIFSLLLAASGPVGWFRSLACRSTPPLPSCCLGSRQDFSSSRSTRCCSSARRPA